MYNIENVLRSITYEHIVVESSVFNVKKLTHLVVRTVEQLAMFWMS